MYGYKIVYIYDGRLAIGLFDFQTFKNSKPSNLNYVGEAFFADGAFRITSGCDVYDFTIADHPTPESVEWVNGHEKARAQQRKRWPNPEKFSSHYVAGWQAGWREKGK